MAFEKVKYFVFCSGKTGSMTLLEGIRNKFGFHSALHIHNHLHFKKSQGGNAKILKNVIINNSKKFDKIYVIDSYREPFERAISSFFQNIGKHCPKWRSMSVDGVINFLNEKKLYLLDGYHSYHESWGYFNISTDVSFDFEKGYISRKHENIIFVKTRLKEAYRWNKIFSEIFGTNISFNYKNNSKNKDYSKLYSIFKQKYKLPQEVKNEFLEQFFNCPKTSDRFYLSISEMKKFMNKEEIDDYLKKWFNLKKQNSIYFL